MLRWICGPTRLDRIRNDRIRQEVQVAHIEDKLREGRLRWLGHVLHRLIDAPVRMCETLVSEGVKRGQSRPKIIWNEVVSEDLQLLSINTNLTKDRA